MKKLFVLLSLAGLLCSTSCSETYDDSALMGRVDDLENRVARLEELCRQMNTNIASLQTLVSALQDHDCITSMTPIESGGSVIGYTIAFSQHAPVTIYHGRNGADGVDGKDGAAPVIGVKQDTDGAYYWTLDGEWLTDEAGAKIRTQGPDGEDGRPGPDGSDGKDGADGAPGQNGSDGADGKDGQDGVTPRLKIENNGWYVSYNNGTNWTYLGQVPSGGTVAAGDSMFRSVDASHADYALFTLADGTEIRVPKFGALAIKIQEGYEVLFNIGETKALYYTVSGVDKDAAVVVKAEMLNADDTYTLRTEPKTASSGTIIVKADVPNTTQIIVSVSDGKQSIMVAVRVGILPVFDEKTVTVATPGTLYSLLAGYDKTTITELTILGNLNTSDIKTLNNLRNLSILDLENVNLKTFSDKAFQDNTSLTSIKLPKTLEIIGNYAFWNCSGLTGNLIIPENVTSIGKLAFAGCSGVTGNLIIPESVVSIGEAAFSSCKGLTGVVIPKSIIAISKQVFYNCSGLTDLFIPDSVTSIEEGMFYGCSGLTGNLIIPANVTSIGIYAFYGCSGFTGNLVIPASVTSIGHNAFCNCSGFTGDLVIPESLTSISSSVFRGCSGFTGNLVIPASITSIDDYAFYECSGFTAVYCKANTPPSINNYTTFYQVISKPLYVPIGSADAYRAADVWKEFKNIYEMDFE